MRHFKCSVYFWTDYVHFTFTGEFTSSFYLTNIIPSLRVSQIETPPAETQFSEKRIILRNIDAWQNIVVAEIYFLDFRYILPVLREDVNICTDMKRRIVMENLTNYRLKKQLS